MTTIAVNAQLGIVAADSLVVQGDAKYLVEKILQLKDGSLLATAGSRYLTGPFELAMLAGKTPMKPDLPDEDEDRFEAIHLRADGIYIYDQTFFSDRLTGPLAAIGTGGKVALSWMLSGASPEEAMRRAIEVDVNSGEPVRSRTMGQPQPKRRK